MNQTDSQLFLYVIFEKIKKKCIFAMSIYHQKGETSMRKAKLNINNENLEDSSEVLRALAHPLRLRILGFIDSNDAINVNKIYNTLKLEQSITSQHLRILRLAGLVETERDGKFIHYRINYDKIGHAMKAINAFLEEERRSAKSKA
ncbi:MAG: metalloregulator ArsR/SmtB family transcription factor [Saprospiraceae bacterium]